MSFKVSDKPNNLIISKNEIIKAKNDTVKESLELNLKPVTQDYKSKADFSKLLKDPKIAENKINFPTELEPDSDPEKTEEINMIDKTINTIKDPNALSVASCILSAVKVPQAEPIKLTVNILTSENKIKSLATDLEKDDYSYIVNSSVDFVKSGWGSAVGVAETAKWGTGIVADLGIISKTGKFATKVNTVTGSAINVASKVAIPFAVLGTGMSAFSIKKSVDKIKDKNIQIRKLDVAISKSKNPNSSNAINAKQKLKTELKVLKVNTGLNSVSFGLSAISTATLIASVKNPAKAKTYATVSLVTGIGSSLVSVFSDDKLRNKISSLVKK